MTGAGPGSRVGIIGLGLVGGSLALDLVERGADVVGTDRDPEHRRLAAGAGVPVVADTPAVVGAADLVVVAVPAAGVAATIDQVTGLAPDVVVTDVCAVKDPSALGVVDAPARWVGGHPMAGTERTGFTAARPGMLTGAPWLLTPADDVDGDALRGVIELVLSVRAVPVVLDAADHDRLVAAVSHVTHLLSYALHGVATGLGREVVDLVAGPSFRDATRVAASDPAVWADLTHRNRTGVHEVLDDVQGWLAAATREDVGDLGARLSAARRRPVAAAGGTAEVVLDPLPRALADLRRLGRQGYAITALEPAGDTARVHLARR